MFSVIIWSVASPLIVCYFLMILVGAGNAYRFVKVNSMSRNLAFVYTFSILSSLCWILCFSLVTEPNDYQYPPYAIAIYSKILVGIAYQSSIFDLKYIVGFYFSASYNQVKGQTDSTDEQQFTRRRKRVEVIMIIWFTVVLIYFFSDLAVNYVFLYFFSSNKDLADSSPSKQSVFLIISYYFVGIQFLILTVLIIWQTFALIKIMKIMGTRLALEQSRLRKLMTMFAISYIGTSAYYIIQVTTRLHCTKSDQCVRFNDFIIRSAIQFFFDIIPISYLYYQHYHTSMESMKQFKATKVNADSVASGASAALTEHEETSTQ